MHYDNKNKNTARKSNTQEKNYEGIKSFFCVCGLYVLSFSINFSYIITILQDTALVFIIFLHANQKKILFIGLCEYEKRALIAREIDRIQSYKVHTKKINPKKTNLFPKFFFSALLQFRLQI